jgi:glyceraldehyde 3-phosphate dehydrogenase
MAKIAINGFGRIGRLFFRKTFDHADMEVVAINDLGNLPNLAYLLKHDTVYRSFDREIKTDNENLIVDGKKIRFFQIKDPAELPWGELGVDVVIESTGVFDSYEKASDHIKGGAKRVIISAPAKDEDGELGQTVLLRVSEEKIKSCKISSNGSCTTNAASPVIATLAENPGIEKAMLNTVHSYTSTQSLVDSPTKGSDFRRGRAAAQNIIPSTTGAAVSVTKGIAELKGQFDGIAIRVPSVTGSIADITFIAKREVTAEEINDILRKSATGKFKGILSVSDEQLVSADIIGSPYASIVDSQFTKVVGGNMVKVLAWYDNEAGYVETLIAHAALAAENIK